MSVLDDLSSASEHCLEEQVVATARRWAWLAPGLFAGLCVYVSYLLTHDYPAFGAGLFLAMSEQAVAQFPVLPDTVPHYTRSGVPYAYPPLQFYITGFILAVTGLDGATVAMHLPHLVSIATLVPLYLFAEELLDSRRGAGLATLFAATAPPILQWQVSAGGIVRAPAYLFTVIGLYTGLRLFRDGERRWIAPSLAAFTLTVLSHPMYTVFFIVAYLTMFGVFRPTPEGLAEGAVVGLGGAVLSGVWWGQVIASHGFDVISGAAGTHGGIGHQLPKLVSLFTAPPGAGTQAVLFAVSPELFHFGAPGMGVLTAWGLVIVAAWIVLLVRRPLGSFLPVWAVASVLFVSKPRFSFLIGTLMVGTVIDRTVLPAVDDTGSVFSTGRPTELSGTEGSLLDRVGRRLSVVRRRLHAVVAPGRSVSLASVAVVSCVFLATTSTAVLYAGSGLDTHAGSTSQPAFIDDSDVAAMEWVAAETRPDATFVVLGDAAEWFPYYTDRTMVVGPWGVEWRGPERYQWHLSAFNQLSTCESAECLTTQFQRRGVSPDYVYVPKGHYTVRGIEAPPARDLVRSVRASDSYSVVHENAGVMILRYDGGTRTPIRKGNGALQPPRRPAGDELERHTGDEPERSRRALIRGVGGGLA